MLNGWHAISIQETAAVLSVNPELGLDRQEVLSRQNIYGANVLTRRRDMRRWLRFLIQFHQPLAYILLGAALVTAIMGQWMDSFVIVAVVMINAVIGFTQESKALSALAALNKSMKTEALVVREGSQSQISAEALVPGDIVNLAPGAKVPADMRLISSRNLQIDESTLTGESVPVAKDAEILLHRNTGLADRINMAYASTLITYGQAKGLVVATADQTEIGRISTLLATTGSLQTPLTRKIQIFSHFLLKTILGLAVLTFVIGVIRGESLSHMFMVAVALTVGAIPEGLPAAITIALAVGVARMARRHAIIRRLPAVETLGSTTVICSDKTGTLTQNQMTVLEVFAGGAVVRVEGTGYSPHGRFTVNGEIIEPKTNAALAECLKAGILCNDSALVLDKGEWRIQGDPTEGALVVSAMKAGLENLRKDVRRVDVIPFDSEYQYMATLHNTGDAEADVIYIKGSVESVIESSISMLDPSGKEVPIDRAALHAQTELMASKGLRVLAFARGKRARGAGPLRHEDLKSNLVLLGIQGMIDPPRTEAIQSIKECRRAGIKVKMITGDHASTAQVIAQRVGLGSSTALPEVITGRQLSEIPDAQLPGRADKTVVFARVTPEQKLRLVTALQSAGNVVAMTGDGVNDGPALKRADIGVAMGISGTEVAKEASEMVLADDNFASIVSAIEEGRGVFANLTKFIVWTLPTNGGEALVVLTSIVLSTTLPMLPIQILWINMTTSVLLGMMLAFEPKEPETMERPPRDPSHPILTRMLIRRIALVSALLLIATMGLFEWVLAHGESESYARTVAVNVLVMGEVFYVFNCRSLRYSIFHIGIFSNRLLWLGVVLVILTQIMFTYLPFMNRLFRTAPITPQSWGLILGASLIISLVAGAEKMLWRQRA